MKMRLWLGAAVHALLGVLFPYVTVGSIVLIYGFMRPPTAVEQMKGIVIVGVYVGFLILLNWLLLKGLPRREKLKAFLIHLFAFASAGIIMMILLRWS